VSVSVSILLSGRTTSAEDMTNQTNENTDTLSILSCDVTDNRQGLFHIINSLQKERKYMCVYLLNYILRTSDQNLQKPLYRDITKSAVKIK